MGREARGICRWGDREGRVTAHLEAAEIVLRGDIRARLALATLRNIAADGAYVRFEANGERIELELDARLARRWAAALAAPQPSLAAKLGITPSTRLHRCGTIDDEALRAAIAAAADDGAVSSAADLAIVRTDDAAVLADRVEELLAHDRVPPVWVVYTKGRAAALGEAAVRDIMRQRGFVDTKVAAVSPLLSAQRFRLRT